VVLSSFFSSITASVFPKVLRWGRGLTWSNNKLVYSTQKNNWMAPWKNRISSTTMKLRKSVIKPVTWQNISSCLVLPPEIVMHDAF